MITCAACGATNPATHRFCLSCGVQLLSTCPACGTATSPDARFCGNCGTLIAPAVGNSRPPPSRAAATPPVPAAVAPPVAERRICSVLFADLVGFTPLSEVRDPEEVRELLSQYFEAARTVIGRYGGVVEKFIGDAVMAVWGTPSATEEDAERCVRAALDVVAAVAELGARVDAPGLRARAGVVTAEVAVTIDATGQGMVAGDAVNTAARVQAAAEPGEVWVDESTHRLAAAAIGFTSAGEHLLKGKTDPVRLWAATRVLSGVGGAQRVDGLEAPLLGRDAELRTIKDLFHASAERHSPRLVVVSGPAGVGKSRLGWEFEKYVDGLADTIYWHRGRCLSYGDGVVFWALAEIVRQRLGIAEEDALDVAAGKLDEGLAKYVSDVGDREYVRPRLARLLGVEVTSDHRGPLPREELFAGWRLFFERLAAVQPVVLLVEDGQYADAGLCDFLDHLIDWAREVPIFALVFTRPELDESRPGFGTGRNRLTLALDPLDAASMDALVEALVPGMPMAARRAITNQAQGIPLFAVETIRALVDRDVVVPRDGVYRLVGDLGALSVPDSLHALLAARLDGLSPDLRGLVADAAVLGTSFSADALLAVSGHTEDSVRSGLAELLRREVLSVSADRLSPEIGNYRFAQDLLRQVAYETLARRDRKSRHLAVAAHLRSTFPGDGDEVADAIARHYLDALEAVPDDPDVHEIATEAVSMLTRAAERAVRSGAPVSAVASYQSAAQLAEDHRGAGPGDYRHAAAELWERAAGAALTVGQWDTADAQAERAAALYKQAGDDRAVGRCQVIAARGLRRAGRHTEAGDRLTAAAAVLRPDPGVDTVELVGELAALETFEGGKDASRLASEALSLAQALDVDPGLLADQFIGVGITHSFANRLPEAVAYFEHAARLAEDTGDSIRRARALLNLADARAPTDAVAAIEAASAAADHARKVGDRYILTGSVGNLAAALLFLGDWDEADRVLTEVIDADQLGDDYLGIDVTILAALRGDAEGAEAGLRRLVALPDSEDMQDLAGVDVGRAFVSAVRGEHRQALSHTLQALDKIGILGAGAEMIRWAWPLAARSAESLDDLEALDGVLAKLDALAIGHVPPLLRAERDLARARAAARAGDPEAGNLLAAGVAAARRAGSPYHLAHALVDHAEYLSATGDQRAALLLVEEARTIATRLGAQPVLTRIVDSTRVVASQGPASSSRS